MLNCTVIHIILIGKVCPAPCTLLSASSVWLQAGAWSDPHRFISFYFDATVGVDRISLAYGPTDLLVEVGVYRYIGRDRVRPDIFCCQPSVASPKLDT